MANIMKSHETTRYTDILDEPIQRLLTPIRGYENQPLLPLAETIEFVSELFNRIEDYVYIALHNCRNPVDNLTQEESAAIQLYTMEFHGGSSLYQLLNKALRNENREQIIRWFSYLKLFLTAIHKLPSESHIVWRGVKGVDLSSRYKKGEKIAWWGVSSCTTEIEVLNAETFLGNNGLRTLFSIQCINGKSIINHSYYKNQEGEVILMPGSYFQVIGQLNPAPELFIIQLKEITPPITFVQPPFSSTIHQTVPNILTKLPSLKSRTTLIKAGQKFGGDGGGDFDDSALRMFMPTHYLSGFVFSDIDRFWACQFIYTSSEHNERRIESNVHGSGGRTIHSTYKYDLVGDERIEKVQVRSVYARQNCDNDLADPSRKPDRGVKIIVGLQFITTKGRRIPPGINLGINDVESEQFPGYTLGYVTGRSGESIDQLQFFWYQRQPG